MYCGRDGNRRAYLSSPASSEVVSGRSEERGGEERGEGERRGGRGEKGSERRGGEGEEGGRGRRGRGRSCETHMRQIFQVLLS